MEPRREEPKAPTPRPEEKRKRFRIVKLEERIAPTKGGNTNGNTCACTWGCGGCGYISGGSIESGLARRYAVRGWHRGRLLIAPGPTPGLPVGPGFSHCRADPN
jgi:hypothetical protein